nr:hypothetical protein [Tanacetum cinerariifolium]
MLEVYNVSMEIKEKELTAQSYCVENLYKGLGDDDYAQGIINCDTRYPLMLYVYKMIPTHVKGKFFAYGHVFFGIVGNGSRVRIMGPNGVPGEERIKTVQRVADRVKLCKGMKCLVKYDLSVVCTSTKDKTQLFIPSNDELSLVFVAENGNSFMPAAQTTTNADGTSTTLIPGLVTTEEKVQNKNDVKERSMLLMALPNEHLMAFNQYKDAKTLFAAIQTRFGGNEATKKTQKTLLKQMYENFSALSTDTNEVNTAYGVSTANTQVYPASTQVSTVSTQVSTANLSDATVYAFLASQLNGFQLMHEDLVHIHKDDLEEMDLKWQLALLSMRRRKFFQKTNRKITISRSDTARYDKSKSYMADDEVPKTWLLRLFQTLRVIFNPKLDLSNSGLEEFQQPEFEGYGPKTSNSIIEDISNKVNESSDAPLVKELVSDDKLEKKTVFPTVAKIEFVRPKQQKKPVKYAEMYRHITGNMSYLSEYEEIDGGYVAFGGDPKGGKITSKGKISTDTECVVLSPDFKLLDESQVLLRVPRKNNMYNVDLNNVAPSRATKDETSGILKAFITRIENLIDHKVKIIRCDNETEFKNKEMNQFCEEKRIKREFSVAMTPQQNKAEAVNTACYVQNCILVIKPHNKTHYKLFNGKTPSLSFMRPFGYLVTILNTLDPLGSRLTWLFDVDTLTKSMNYKVVVAGSQSNGSAGKARVEIVPDKDYILLLLWNQDLLFSSSSKDSPGAGCKPSRQEEKKDAKEIVYSDDDKDVGAEADMTNLDNNIPVNSILTTRIHKNHPVKQIIGDIHSAPQTRTMTKNVTKIEEEVYVCQPLGFKDPEFPNRVYKVEKALYGLHQSPRAWYETLSTYLLDNRFHRGQIDKTFFIKRVKGLQVTPKDDRIFISQDKYVDKILKKFGFSTVKTASTPMETSKPLLNDENAEDVDVHLYRPMIGSLMYLTSLRPDIIYLKGQPKLGLWFPKDLPFNLEAYTDSDYAGASLDRKSITGGCQFLGSRLISWQCKKKIIVANFTTKVDAKTTAWNEFSRTMASDIICLATNQKFNFSKYIFDNMVKNLEGGVKFLMFPRLVQGKDFSGRVTPLFPTMLMQAQHEVDERTDTQQTPTIIQPTTSQPQRKQKPRKTRRKDTKLPQSSVPTEVVADEAIYEEMYDSVERAATTATGLYTEHDTGIISKTQFTATLNEPSSIRTSLGSGPRRQETIGDAAVQTRSEREDASKQGRIIDNLDADKGVTLVDETQRRNDQNMFDTGVLDDEEVVVEKEVSITDLVTTTGEVVTTAGVEVSAATTTPIISIDDITLSKALAALKSTKPMVKEPSVPVSAVSTTSTTITTTIKAKGIVMQELEETTIRTTTSEKNLESDKSKKHKLDEKIEAEEDNDQEEAEMKMYMKIVFNDEIAIDAIPLATKPPIIVDWKIIKEGKISSYHIIRQDGSSKRVYADRYEIKDLSDKRDFEKEAVISDENLLTFNKVDKVESFRGLVKNSSTKATSFHTVVEEPKKLSLMKVAALIESISKQEGKVLDLQSKLMENIEWLPLDVYANQLTNLPDSFGQLVNLLDIDLHANRLNSLPDSFKNLSNSINLDLSSNHFTHLPDLIGNLTSMQILVIKTNDLEELPYTIGSCSSLIALKLDFNQLKGLPKALGKLESLEILTLFYNHVRKLPTTMANLVRLKELDGMLIPVEILKVVLNFLLLIIITLTFEEDIQRSDSAWKAYMNARVAGLFLLVLLEYPNGNGVDETSEPLLYAGWMVGPYRCKDTTWGQNDDPMTSGIRARLDRGGVKPNHLKDVVRR